MYEKDRPLFSSRTRWAGSKLLEVIVATREEGSTEPKRLCTIVTADLLSLLKVDIEPIVPNIDEDLIQDLLSSIFPGINPVGSSKGCRSISCGVCSDRASSFFAHLVKRNFVNRAFCYCGFVTIAWWN